MGKVLRNSPKRKRKVQPYGFWGTFKGPKMVAAYLALAASSHDLST